MIEIKINFLYLRLSLMNVIHFFIFVMLVSFPCLSMEKEREKPINEEVLAVKLSVAVFHLYDQGNKGEPLDLSKPVQSDLSIFGYTLSYDYPALKDLCDWQFKPFQGHLGFYSTYKMTGEMNKEVFGVVGYHPPSNTLAVVFRGSRKVEDYIYNNFNVTVKFPLSQRKEDSWWDYSWVEGYHNFSFEGPLHQGYTNRLMTCQDSLISQLTYFLDSTKPNPTLLITGHSLGGAVACLFAGALVSQEKPTQDLPMIANQFYKFKDRFSKISLLPFGAPRVSDQTYGLWLKNQGVHIRHFVGEADFVPLYPTYQVVNPLSLSWSTYADIDERVVLSSHDVEKYTLRETHDIRLYWYAMAKRENISPDSFPLFRRSNDSEYLKKLLGFTEK